MTLSLGLHILAMVFVPSLRWEELKEPEVLLVELAPPQVMPEPIVTPEPEPVPKSEPPPPPKEIPKPRIEPKPTPKIAPSSEPVAEPPPVQEEAQTVAPPIITAPPEIETPTFTAPPPPPPEPPKPVGPTQADLDAARSLYKSRLEQEIVKHKEYPRIAKMRGWQGEVMIELQIDQNGRPGSIKVQTSSGYDTLDKTAIEMVRKTVAATQLPDILRGNSSTFLVPVAFRLEN